MFIKSAVHGISRPILIRFDPCFENPDHRASLSFLIFPPVKTLFFHPLINIRFSIHALFNNNFHAPGRSIHASRFLMFINSSTGGTGMFIERENDRDHHVEAVFHHFLRLIESDDIRVLSLISLNQIISSFCPG